MKALSMSRFGARGARLAGGSANAFTGAFTGVYAGALGGLIATAAAMLLCLPAAASAQQLKIGLKSEPTSMDPLFHVLAPNIQTSRHIFEGLTMTDAEMRVQPSLALSWRNVSDLVWEFKLRPNVKFSDGSPFTAEDVVFSIARAAKVPNSPTPFTLYTRTIERVEVVDPLTVRLHTSEIRAVMPQDIAFIPMMSKKAASGPNPEGMSTAELNQGKGLIGTGPFKFVSWSRGAEIVLERNEGYWGSKPHWQQVTMRPITNSAARVSALLSGSVDIVEDPPTDDLAQLRTNPKLNIVEITSVRVIYLALGFSGGSFANGKNPLHDVRVRRALSQAVDRPALVQRVMEGSAVAAADLMPSSVPGSRPDAKLPKFDPAEAKRLLAEAGYPQGFSLTLGAPNGRYINDLKLAQAIATMWGRVGVKAQVEASAPPLFFKNAATQTYDATLVGWGDAEMSSRLRALIASADAQKGRGAANFGRYSNPAVDALIEQAMGTLAAPERIALLQQASAKALDEDFGVLPLHFERTSWGMRKGLTYLARPDQQLYAQYLTPAKTD